MTGGLSHFQKGAQTIMRTGIGQELLAKKYPASNHGIAELASPDQSAVTTDTRPLQVPQAMCEAYDYPSPSAFSRGMEVDIGSARLVFVSGTASVGPDGKTLYVGDFRAQAWRTFQNARAVLRAAGADWQNVVKATIFLKDIARYYSPFNWDLARFSSHSRTRKGSPSPCWSGELTRRPSYWRKSAASSP